MTTLLFAWTLLAADDPPPRVPVAKPVRTELKRVSVQPGVVVPDAETALHARVSGYVSKVHVDIGAKVAAGQALVELAVPDLDAELAAREALVAQATADAALAEAGVAAAQADADSAAARIGDAVAAVALAKAERQRWESEAQRVAALAADSATPGERRDEAQFQCRAAVAGEQEAGAKAKSAEALAKAARARTAQAQAGAAAAHAKLRAARASANVAAAQAAFAVVKAPYAGVVTARQAEVGQLASALAPPLLTLVRVDPVRVRIDFPEADARLAVPGARVDVTFPALPGVKHSKTLTRVAWALDRNSRTLRAEVDLPNPDGALRGGLYAQAATTLAARTNALAVPAAAVIAEPQPHVYLARDGVARKALVTVGLTVAGQTEILSGLTDADEVVQSAAAGLQDGQAIHAARPGG